MNTTTGMIGTGPTIGDRERQRDDGVLLARIQVELLNRRQWRTGSRSKRSSCVRHCPRRRGGVGWISRDHPPACTRQGQRSRSGSQKDGGPGSSVSVGCCRRRASDGHRLVGAAAVLRRHRLHASYFWPRARVASGSAAIALAAGAASCELRLSRDVRPAGHPLGRPCECP